MSTHFAGDEGVEPSINLLERFVIPLHQSPNKKGIVTYYPFFDAYAKLFFSFLEDDVLAKLGRIFLILYLTFNQLLILTSPISLAC